MALRTSFMPMGKTQKPDGCEFYHTDGTMYFDLGLIPTISMRMEFKVGFYAPNMDNHVGIYANNENNDFRFIMNGYDAVWDYGDTRISIDRCGTPLGINDNYTRYDGNWAEIICDAKGSLSIGNELGKFSKSSTPAKFVPVTDTLKLCGDPTRQNKFNVMDIYYLKIFDNDILVANFIPKTNGLYDAVSKMTLLPICIGLT